MALIKCKKCGGKITDTIKKCPHCGCINENYRNIKLEMFNKKRSIIIACIVAGICITIFFLAGGVGIVGFIKQSESQANMLSSEEELAAEAVKKLRTYLNENDKLNINELWYRKYSSANQILINYSFKDDIKEKGVIIQLVEDGKLIANDIKADKNITKYTAKKESEEISKAKEVRDLWNTKGDAYELFVKLDKDKILKNIER